MSANAELQQGSALGVHSLADALQVEGEWWYHPKPILLVQPQVPPVLPSTWAIAMSAVWQDALEFWQGPFLLALWHGSDCRCRPGIQNPRNRKMHG